MPQGRDDSWDYFDILWNGVQAAAVQAAFDKLTYRGQRLLEECNAVCIICGRASPLSKRKTFEELAVMFEGSTASGAERAYCKAVEKLTVRLVEWDTMVSKMFAKQAMKYIRYCDIEHLPQKLLFSF